MYIQGSEAEDQEAPDDSAEVAPSVDSGQGSSLAKGQGQSSPEKAASGDGTDIQTIDMASQESGQDNVKRKSALYR